MRKTCVEKGLPNVIELVRAVAHGTPPIYAWDHSSSKLHFQTPFPPLLLQAGL